MIVASAFSHTATLDNQGKPGPLTNAQLAMLWLDWCARLGGLEDTELVLLGPQSFKLPESAQAWKKVTYIRDRSDIRGWPYGPNSAFTQLCWHFFYRKADREAWLFCEPDCVPLKETWLAEIKSDYASGGKPFMGANIPAGAGYPEHMTGNAIYPADAIQLAPSLVSEKRMNVAWDIRSAFEVVPQMYGTKLICQRFRRPRFTSMAELRSEVPHEAVLFHSDKYGAIATLLAGEPTAPPGPPLTVPPVPPEASTPAPEPQSNSRTVYSMSELLELIEANVKTETARARLMTHLHSKHFHQKNFGAALKELALAKQ
jgi:hypothetical protein